MPFLIPTDIPPSVTLSYGDGIAAGVPAQVYVNANRGTHYTPINIAGIPIVTYTRVWVSIDNVQVFEDPHGAGGLYSVTFPTVGGHSVTAGGVTGGGAEIRSQPITVQVAASGAPVFTVVAPVNNLEVPLGEGGAQVNLELTVRNDQLYPLTVSISWDNQTTTHQLTGPQFQTPLALAPMPLGPRTISVTCTDPHHLQSTQSLTLIGHDNAAPRLQIIDPPPSGTTNIMGADNGAALVPIHGTAPDTQSGMVGGQANVEWALTPTGARTRATAGVGNDFSNWTTEVPVSGFGAHTIYVWAADQVGNTADAQVSVVVISSYVPRTLGERLNEREYLAALLSFAQEQVTVPGPPLAPLDTATLVAVLGQPVDRLSQPLSAAADRGNVEINQLRVPVELLRTYIASQNPQQTPTGAGAERTYRDMAYASLLAANGTSYPELRLARGADPVMRQALASRLGIRLSATAPDELDQLILDGATLTDVALDAMFGLPDSNDTDPFRALPTPLLLQRQLAALALSWAEQDQHPDVPRAFVVLIDPDIISPSDVVADTKGHPIRQLLADRAAQLTTYAGALTTAAQAATDPAHALAAMLSQALPGVDLPGIATKDSLGEDTSADLQAAGLTRGGFLFLRQAQLLVAAGPLTGAERDDAVGILTSAHKRITLYAAWRAQETPFVLSPDFFLIGDAAPDVNGYRADAGARADWQTVLRARITQRQNLIDSSTAAITATEQVALPMLRDALLADLAGTTTGDVGEEMTARFLVDTLAGGTLRTTRLEQAIESVQTFLIAKKSGELPVDHPAFGWMIEDVDSFTTAWTWMGELGSWQAASTASLFPERNLDPTLLLPNAQPPQPLDTFWINVRGSGPFSSADADLQAHAYLKLVGHPDITYRDPHRSAQHQDDLQKISKIVEGSSPNLAREMFWAAPLLLAQRMHTSGNFADALDWYWIVYPYDDATPISIYDRINAETLTRPNLTFPPHWTETLDPFALVANRPAPYTRYTLLCIIRCHLDYADAEFARETDESVAHARILYLNARRLLNLPQLQPQQPTNAGEPALAIPELNSLLGRTTMQLAKLRQGRNIAGMPRARGLSAQLTVSQPTPYRYKTLLVRAQQLAAQANQMEAGYLAALEKYDAANLRLYDAVKAIDLSAAQVNVASSRVAEANDAVTAAVAQKTKAQTMADAYSTAISAPPNQYEQNLLGQYHDLAHLGEQVAAANAVIGALNATAAGTNLFSEVVSGGSAGVLAAEVAVSYGVKGYLEGEQADLQGQIQANQLQAGIEQRQDEWRIQMVSAQQDTMVAAAQVVTARDQVTIAAQEHAVATLQHDQAVSSLKFLNDQFTNPDLYNWMSTTLGGVYRYFLQQATVTARLAQDQLAFERAEAVQNLIRNDYWQSPGELIGNPGQVDRRGLTGAEQLTEDLSRLDEYAVSSDRRRLNITQSFSFAKLAPIEFIDFRQTGTITFATPRSLFDADFPGHYLRLIRRASISVSALMDPARGMRAQLSTTGISRVITGSDGDFRAVVLRHDPDVVALTSPINANGVFELDAQSDMLLPFESNGVDTTWQFQLPPAANPFDFSTIVDVILTLEYTALYDDYYRNEITTQLNADRQRRADCVFSIVRDYPDQWYDLNNPPDPTNRTVTLTLSDSDFPFGIGNITATAIAVRVASQDPLPNTIVSLHHGLSGGDGILTGNIASTRRGAASWNALCGSSPSGDWVITFGADAEPLFGGGEIQDVLLMISWSGEAPLWVS